MAGNVVMTLKDTDIYLRDGYPIGGVSGLVQFAINNAGGYSSSATTMIIDTGVGSLFVGDRFTVTGSTAKHRITARTNTSGNTTSVTFTPGLTGSVADNALLSFLPRYYQVVVGQGDASVDWEKPRKVKLSRGRLSSIINDDEKPTTFNCEVDVDFFTGVAGTKLPTIFDVLDQTGEASHWVSSDTANPCQPYSVELVIAHKYPCGGYDWNILRLPTFRYDSQSIKMKEGTLTLKGISNEVKPIFELIADYTP